MLVGTPEHMSPEQADLTVQDVDTRTDVYALGVMLYERPGPLQGSGALSRETLDIEKRVLGPEHPDTLMPMINLANVYSAQGRSKEAEALSRSTSRSACSALRTWTP